MRAPPTRHPVAAAPAFDAKNASASRRGRDGGCARCVASAGQRTAASARAAPSSPDRDQPRDAPARRNVSMHATTAFRRACDGRPPPRSTIRPAHATMRAERASPHDQFATTWAVIGGGRTRRRRLHGRLCRGVARRGGPAVGGARIKSEPFHSFPRFELRDFLMHARQPARAILARSRLPARHASRRRRRVRADGAAASARRLRRPLRDGRSREGRPPFRERETKKAAVPKDAALFELHSNARNYLRMCFMKIASVFCAAASARRAASSTRPAAASARAAADSARCAASRHVAPLSSPPAIPSSRNPSSSSTRAAARLHPCKLLGHVPHDLTSFFRHPTWPERPSCDTKCLSPQARHALARSRSVSVGGYARVNNYQ